MASGMVRDVSLKVPTSDTIGSEDRPPLLELRFVEGKSNGEPMKATTYNNISR